MRWHIPLVIFLAALFGTATNTDARPTDSPDAGAASAPLFEIDGYASDPDYGYRPTRPILLGGIDLAKPPDDYDLAERKDLIKKLLRAPMGEPLIWERVQPCCPLGPSQGGAAGEGLLDVYLVAAPGQRPIRLFVNHYKTGPVRAPIGLVFHRAADAAREVHEALIVASAGKEQRAVEILTPHAGAGDILAQFYLGVLNLRAKKPDEAVRWFTRAAEQEHGPSQMALAAAAGDARAARAFADFEKTESPELITQIKRSADALTHSPTQ